LARVNRPCLADWADASDLSDLSLLPDEKLSVSRLRIELLAQVHPLVGLSQPSS